MSNEEKKRRENYRESRKRWIVIQIIVIAFISLMSVVTGVLFYESNKTQYIDYNETSEVDYRVYLKENNFFEEEYIGKDQAYVVSLIDHIEADFDYVLDMEVENVNYEYSYVINATMQIIDDKSNRPIFNPTYEIKKSDVLTQNSNSKLKIKESVAIDYEKYNQLANEFLEIYDLPNMKSSLIVSMNIKISSACEEFVTGSNNEYKVSLNVPLASKTIDITMSTTVPNEETKILACKDLTKRDPAMVAFYTFIGADIVLIAILIAYIILTRNTDINYEIKVKKIVSEYKSYIQKINNPFDENGYQVLKVDTFEEMLEIRDTIQSPILMHENLDKTCSKFIIPTTTKLLYVYEIKVDDYDQIYSIEEDKLAI